VSEIEGIDGEIEIFSVQKCFELAVIDANGDAYAASAFKSPTAIAVRRIDRAVCSNIMFGQCGWVSRRSPHPRAGSSFREGADATK
jgi:hypothetical protein